MISTSIMVLVLPRLLGYKEEEEHHHHKIPSEILLFTSSGMGDCDEDTSLLTTTKLLGGEAGVRSL